MASPADILPARIHPDLPSLQKYGPFWRGRRKGRGKVKTADLLELIPTRTVQWEKKEDGLIVLLKPKFKHPFFVKHILPRMIRPHYRIKLDKLGSHVWERCDGNLTVKEIGENLKSSLGEKAEPITQRLALFLQSLERNRFISYK